MATNRDGNTKIPMLKRNEFTHWRVKMLNHLEATDPDYLDIIADGVTIPKRMLPRQEVDGKPVGAEQYVLKTKKEWTNDERETMLKDAKVRNILFNSLDTAMTNYVLSCKTAKEIWDKITIHCEGTEHIRKNLKSVLVQQYEAFEAKPEETLTETYDRFTKLLNELALHGKIYDNDDVNTKFLRALSSAWEYKVVAIREANDLEMISLEAVYGKLRAYDLEVQQKKQARDAKAKPVALTVESEEEEAADIPLPKVEKKKSSKKALTAQLEESESDESIDSDSADSETDVDELAALLARALRGKKFRRFRSKAKQQAKDQQVDEKRRTDKSKKKQYIKLDKSKLKCFNCGETGHFSAECKKAKKTFKGKGKGKALLTTEKDWAETSSSSEDGFDYENIALMVRSSEKASSSTDSSIIDKVSPFCLEFIRNSTVNSLGNRRDEIADLWIDCLWKHKECDRIGTARDSLLKKVEQLENEKKSMIRLIDEGKEALIQLEDYKKANESLYNQLVKEQSKFEQWVKSSKINDNIVKMQGNLSSGIGYDGGVVLKEDKTLVETKEASTQTELNEPLTKTKTKQ